MRVLIRVIVETEAWIDVDPKDSANEICRRNCDIYLHGKGEEGWSDKQDLGGSSKISIIKIEN